MAWDSDGQELPTEEERLAEEIKHEDDESWKDE